MLLETILDLPTIIGQAMPIAAQGKIFHPPEDTTTNIEMLLRWIHFIAGITWIGHLYYFNLVNANLMKALEAPVRGKVVPQLMPRALWWFRWGAMVTVLAGVFYYILILHSEPTTWVTFAKWFGVVMVTFVIIFALLRQSYPVGRGWLLGVIVGVLVSVMAIALLLLTGGEGLTRTGTMQYASSRALSVGIGGGLGLIMLFNVWGIIWPHQKRIIAWTYDSAEKGIAVPAESAVLARRAFLASRMNTWLSIPMLFFMAAASHYPLFGR
jgi:uncharacterized membrane protein